MRELTREEEKRLITRLAVTLMAFLAVTWPATGIASAQEWTGKSESRTANGFQVEFTTPAEGIKVGENRLVVRLKEESAGKPVQRESVRVDFLMDEADKSMNHGEMADQKPVVVDLEAVKGSPATYEGTVSLPDAGGWKARVFVDPRGIQTPVTFNVRAGSNGPNWLVLGGFATLLVAAIGGVVALARKRPAPSPANAAQEASEA